MRHFVFVARRMVPVTIIFIAAPSQTRLAHNSNVNLHIVSSLTIFLLYSLMLLIEQCSSHCVAGRV